MRRLRPATAVDTHRMSSSVAPAPYPTRSGRMQQFSMHRARTVRDLAVLVVMSAWCAALSASGAAADDRSGRPAVDDAITALPGLGDVATTQYGGYASVGEDPCAGLRCDGFGEAGLYY